MVPETRSVQLLRVSSAPLPDAQKPWWRRLGSGSSPPPREELRVDGVTFATLDPLGQSLALTAGGAYMVYRMRGLRGASPSFSVVSGTPGTPDSMFFSACGRYLASHFSHHTGASMLTLQHVPPLPPRDNHRGVPLTEAQQLIASPGALSLAFSPAADVMAVLRASSALPELYVFRLGATAAGWVSASRFTLVRTLEDADRPTAAPGRVPLSTAPLFSHDGRHLWYVSALGGAAILEAVDVSQVEVAPLIGGDPAMPPWPVWTIDLGLDPMGDPPTQPYQLAASPNGRFLSVVDPNNREPRLSLGIITLPPAGLPLMTNPPSQPQRFQPRMLGCPPLTQPCIFAQWSPNGRLLLLLTEEDNGQASWMVLEPGEESCEMAPLPTFQPSPAALQRFRQGSPARLWSPDSEAFVYGSVAGVFVQRVVTTELTGALAVTGHPPAERLADGDLAEWGAA